MSNPCAPIDTPFSAVCYDGLLARLQREIDRATLPNAYLFGYTPGIEWINGWASVYTQSHVSYVPPDLHWLD